MSASSDNLRLRYPEFADTSQWPDATLDLRIADAAARLDPAVWDCFFEQASLALAAHLLRLTSDSANAGSGGVAGSGALSSVRTKDLSVTFSDPSFNVMSADEAFYARSPYGMDFLELRSRVVIPAFITAC